MEHDCIRLLDLDCNKPFVFEKYTVLLIVRCTSVRGRKKSPTVIRLQVIEGPNVPDHIGFCALHSFLVEDQTNAGYIHATHA